VGRGEDCPFNLFFNPGQHTTEPTTLKCTKLGIDFKNSVFQTTSVKVILEAIWDI
jgi:hypothetical protein